MPYSEGYVTSLENSFSSVIGVGIIMKNLKIIIATIFIASWLYAPSVLAVKRAPFDNSPLQPMPISDVKPNISGNVNFKPNQTPSNVNSTQPEKSDTSDQNSSDNSPLEESSFTPYFIIWIIIFVFVIGLLILAFSLLKSKK